MSAEIIYGIDFRAGKEEAPLCNAPDCLILPQLFADWPVGTWSAPVWPDAAPSEYVAPDGDCA